MHTDAFTLDDLQALAAGASGPHVSVYLPTRRVVNDAREEKIRLKNLLDEVDKQLKARGVRDVSAYTGQIRATMQQSHFWNFLSDGLAIFLAEDFARTFRLPVRFPELAVVNTRFHIKPMLPFLAEDGRFYVLALSQNRIRLIQCTRHTAQELELEGLPKDMADALRYDEPEKALQFHTGTAPSSAQGGRRQAMFHGQGGNDASIKADLLRTFQKVNDVVGKFLAGEHAPLVLAGVEYLFPIYAEANAYKQLVEGGVAGNPDELGADELKDRALDLVEPGFTAGRQKDLDDFAAKLGTGLASADPAVVVPAAVNSRVQSLFVAVGRQLWGSYDPAANAIAVEPERGEASEDLLDLAAVWALKTGGTVHAVQPGEVPGGGDVAALFRY